MVQRTIVAFECDNCGVEILDPKNMKTWEIKNVSGGDVKRRVDTCETCAEKIATLAERGTPVSAGRPKAAAATGRKRGRPRKVEAEQPVVVMPGQVTVEEAITEAEAAQPVTLDTMGQPLQPSDWPDLPPREDEATLAVSPGSAHVTESV